MGYLLGYVGEGLVEEVKPLLFHLAECFPAVFRSTPSVLEVLLGGLQSRFNPVESLNGTHVRVKLLEFGVEICDFVLELLFKVFDIGLGYVSQIRDG